MYLSISKCIRLGKEIGHQFIMITHSFPCKRCITVSILKGIWRITMSTRASEIRCTRKYLSSKQAADFLQPQWNHKGWPFPACLNTIIINKDTERLILQVSFTSFISLNKIGYLQHHSEKLSLITYHLSTEQYTDWKKMFWLYNLEVIGILVWTHVQCKHAKVKKISIQTG
jgi:hypothetical protein